MRTYAIGDIHGCVGLLSDLLRQIDRDAAGETRRIVCLGDYVDRGPDSAGVILTLRALQKRGEDVICLKGNHEDLMLGAVRVPGPDRDWWIQRSGGRETLASFGADSVDGVPDDILRWIAECPTGLDDGRRYFVHAGLNPTLPLDAQRDEDRLWIRRPFLDSNHDFGRYVVHGHTPLRTGIPDQRPRRVNLDTAAVYGGRLTAAIFSDAVDAPLGFLQA